LFGLRCAVFALAEPEASALLTTTPDVEMMDFAKKALHVSWHPSDEVFAVAGMNKIYIYQAARSAAVTSRRHSGDNGAAPSP